MSIPIKVYTNTNRYLCDITIDEEATIKDIKKEIHKTSKLPVCRQAIRTNETGTNQNDCDSVKELNLKNGDRIYVKDLGPQIGWKTVFMLEYLGPLILYSLFASRPDFIYDSKQIDEPFSSTATAALICWNVHFFKRLLETLFVHRFSHDTMPLKNLFRNCAYYWGFSCCIGYVMNDPLYEPPDETIQTIGLAIFILCEIGNFSTHMLLRNLRTAGSKERKIPMPNRFPLTLLFSVVSCPNYTYEFGSWIGFALITHCLPVVLFALIGFFQMTVWALAKHKAYKIEFEDYPKNRKAIIPFII